MTSDTLTLPDHGFLPEATLRVHSVHVFSLHITIFTEYEIFAVVKSELGVNGIIVYLTIVISGI